MKHTVALATALATVLSAGCTADSIDEPQSPTISTVPYDSPTTTTTPPPQSQHPQSVRTSRGAGEGRALLFFVYRRSVIVTVCSHVWPTTRYYAGLNGGLHVHITRPFHRILSRLRVVVRAWVGQIAARQL